MAIQKYNRRKLFIALDFCSKYVWNFHHDLFIYLHFLAFEGIKIENRIAFFLPKKNIKERIGLQLCTCAFTRTHKHKKHCVIQFNEICICLLSSSIFLQFNANEQKQKNKCAHTISFFKELKWNELNSNKIAFNWRMKN